MGDERVASAEHQQSNQNRKEKNQRSLRYGSPSQGTELQGDYGNSVFHKGQEFI